MRRAALPDGGHLAKALEHILASYPRDDLFQIGEDELHDTALGILAAGERQRLRLFLWRDPYERFVSCLVYVPREAYSTELRKKFQAILMAAFAGQRADFAVLLGDTLLARVHFTIRTPAGQVPAYDTREIEARLAAAARRWDDELRDALVDEAGEGQGMALFKRWGAAFPQVYREIHRARAAVPDVLKVDALTPEQPLGLALYHPLGGSARSLGFKVYRLGAPVVLSDSLPMLEHMGVRVMGEDNFRIRQGQGDAAMVSMHDFKLDAPASDELEPEALARLLRRRLCPASSAARWRTTTSTAWCCAPAWPPTTSWCCAPMPGTAGRSASRCRRPRSRPRWRRSRTSRACWSSCSTCACTPPSTTTTPPPRRCMPSSRRWTVSATSTKTACCASCWR